MKLPGWLVALFAVPLLGAAGVWARFSLAANSAEGVVGAAVLGVIALWVMVRAARSQPRATNPEGARLMLEVPTTVGLGGGFPVRAKMVLTSRLPLNPHRQRVRFFIEERWLPAADQTELSAIVYEEVLPVHAPVDTVGEWETTVTAHVPPDAPSSCDAERFRVHAWVEFSVPYGMFGELTTREPVVILPEVAK